MSKKFLTGIDVSNQKIIQLADGTAPTDAVNLQQMQAFVRGLSWKQSVRAASTANVTLATPGASMDGYTLVSGDRVLLKDQTASGQNGIYVWTGAAAALTRALDADSSAELLGATVYVESGTVNADKAFTQTADAIATLNTSPVTFAQFGGGTTST
jgi:phage-related tail fiber protein